MPAEEQDPFGEYAPEPQTGGVQITGQPTPPDEIESEKYGIGKPRRIIVRGKVAADPGTEGRQE